MTVFARSIRISELEIAITEGNDYKGGVYSSSSELVSGSILVDTY